MNPAPATRARVLLLIPHLGTGGAQHVIATLARHLDSSKYEIHLALLTQPTCPDTEFPTSVRIHCLGAKRARHATLRVISLVRRLKPQLILIGMAHLAPLVLLFRCLLPARTAILLRQNGALSSVTIRPRLLSRPVLPVAYRRADLLICQTQSTADELHRTFLIDQARLRILPNPVDVQSFRDAIASGSQQSDPYLLAVGRLVPEKGFDLLLDAFALLKPDFPALRLLIAGSGPCQPALQSQARRLSLENHVEFLGNVASPARYFADAQAFVLSSRQDEMPNALLEAAAAGLPIIATPASPGIAALLAGRPGAWLATDSSSAALALVFRKALASLRPRQRFPHQWIEPFALQPALAAWEQLFDRVLAGQKT